MPKIVCRRRTEKMQFEGNKKQFVHDNAGQPNEYAENKAATASSNSQSIIQQQGTNASSQCQLTDAKHCTDQMHVACEWKSGTERKNCLYFYERDGNKYKHRGKWNYR